MRVFFCLGWLVVLLICVRVLYVRVLCLCCRQVIIVKCPDVVCGKLICSGCGIYMVLCCGLFCVLVFGVFLTLKLYMLILFFYVVFCGCGGFLVSVGYCLMLGFSFVSIWFMYMIYYVACVLLCGLARLRFIFVFVLLFGVGAVL